VYPDFYQLDQTCCTLWAICELADHLEGPERTSYLSEMEECAHRALSALLETLQKDGLHETAADAWEVHRGSFTYTNSALYAALRGCERVFEADCGSQADRVKEAVIEKLWIERERRFARGLTITRELDTARDSSTLGVFDPYGLLDLSDSSERSMAADHLAAIEDSLGVDTKGGTAILRFENESYMGGGPAAVNTLWVARSHLRLARTAEGDEVADRVQKARQYIGTALANTNPTGQLPELIPWNGYDYWAAPHGWATAVLVDCIRMLAEFPDHAGSAPTTR
jgi:GH15 family glucan-1,4-alpha-glucosidase